MIAPTHSFSRPFQVVQLHRKQQQLGKEEKGSFDLKAFLTLDGFAPSAGFVNENRLFLSDRIQDRGELHGADLLVIESDLTGSEPGEFHFLRTSRANALRIFQIRGQAPLELYLEWSYFYVGDPSRPNMKLCDLTAGKAYEIRINGKTDFSLTGRRPRHYLEQVFVVEHLGIFTECSLISDSQKLPPKKLPEPRKLIDLRKLLW